MSDILPKVKMYTFISIIAVCINIVAVIMSITNTVGFDLGVLVIPSVTAFIPFFSFINISFLNMPEGMIAIYSLITGIFSFIQAFILAMAILQLAKNILWQPDV